MRKRKAAPPPSVSIPDWIKRQTEILGGGLALWAILSGLYVGIVTLTGGNVVPWATPGQLRAVVEAGVGELRITWDREKNAEKCKDYNSRLRRAEDEVSRNPGNMFVQSVYADALDTISTIPDCGVRRP